MSHMHNIYIYVYVYICIYIYTYPLCSLFHCISKAPGRRLDLSSVPIGLADGWPTGTTAQMFVPWARLGASGGRAFFLFGHHIIKHTWPGMSCAKTLRRNCVYVCMYIYIYIYMCHNIWIKTRYTHLLVKSSERPWGKKLLTSQFGFTVTFFGWNMDWLA